MGHSVNSSLFAGLAAGAGLVLAGVIGATVIFPPPPSGRAGDTPLSQPAPEGGVLAPRPLVEGQPDTPVATLDPAPQDMPEGAADAPLPDADMPDFGRPEDLVLLPPQGADMAEDMLALEDTVLLDAPADTELTDIPVPHSPHIDLHPPLPADALPEDGAPALPDAQDNTAAPALLPSAASAPRADMAIEGVELVPPAPLAQVEDAPQAGSDPEAESAPARQASPEPRQTMPGIRAQGLPRIGGGEDVPVTVDQDPVPDVTPRPALLRNSVYQAQDGTADKMALILSDAGLPMPIRRDLAALDLPFTIALDPMDSTAQEAAEIYHAAGKEVVILASGLPSGATASDLDVSFNVYFGAVPLAVAVIDVPENGFARNAGLLREVLPLLAQDGHGLLTFAGGLTQAGRAATAAGIAHAEVFRVLDAAGESVFTIRRYLDRAVFQASQIGHVIVFGDAANEETLDALQTWQAERRSGQVALVPVSGILLRDD